MCLQFHVCIPGRLKPLKVIEFPLSAPCDPPALPSSTPDLSDVGGRRQVKGSQDRQGMNGALSANSEDTCTEEVSIFNKQQMFSQFNKPLSQIFISVWMERFQPVLVLRNQSASFQL